MRLLVAAVLLSLVACKKPKPPPAPASQAKCTMAFLRVADPDRCETACFSGDADACDLAASQFHRGILTRRDPGRALSLAAKGCDLGSSGACMSVASVLSGQYDGAWPDGGVYANAEEEKNYRQKSLAAADRECNQGRFDACSFLAYAAARSGADGEARALALASRAVSLMSKGCEQGDGFACTSLGTAYSVGGLDLARDEAKALELAAKGCAAGHAEACGQAFTSKAEDSVRAPFLQRGCELGQGDLCFLWSLQLEGAAKTKALQRGCDLRDGLSCHALARASKGEDSEKLLKRACAVGYENACR